MPLVGFSTGTLLAVPQVLVRSLLIGTQAVVMVYCWDGCSAIWLSLEKKIHQKWKPNNWIFFYETIKAESITLSALKISDNEFSESYTDLIVEDIL